MNQRLIVFLLCGTAIVAFPSRHCVAQGTSLTNAEGKYSERTLFENVSSNAVECFQYMSQCKTSTGEMVEGSTDKVTACFIAAKLAWLSGRPTAAIGTLEDVINKYGMATHMQLGLQNAIVANLWIGTIARHSGDVQRAKKAYDCLLATGQSNENMNGLAILSFMYQAETADKTLNNQDTALKYLKAIKEIKTPVDQNAIQLQRVYQEWADYEVAVITEGAERARSILNGNYHKREACVLLAMNQLQCNGIVSEPRIGFYNDDRQILFKRSLELAVECRTSPIDRSLAQLLLARIAEEKKDMAEAEKYYGDLLAGDSFLAPEGGINLACFQKKQGKLEESRKTFAKVKERFPGYSKLVEDLSKDDEAASTPLNLGNAINP